ncbi:MAG: PilZ domain-containing protein [Sedimentisphaerales bacterium]|nr:PilZ domain-containing protein [Sedimentisphaerales bacterium]
MSDSVREKIKTKLRASELSLEDLYDIESFLKELINDTESKTAQLSDEEGRKLRREVRFETCLRAKVARITDIKPGEVEEFPAVILDISRSGMSLKVRKEHYLHSDFIKVSFLGPRGHTKDIYLKVLSVQDLREKRELWNRLGCRSVSEEELRALHEQEKKRKPVVL